MSDIRRLSEGDAADVAAVINAAAERYRGVIPEEADTEPYMPMAELESEMDAITFYGLERDGLAGVIGIQALADVTLIRHLYVRPGVQRHGLGSRLLAFATEQADTETVLVGTWRAAGWAIGFYEANGFDLVDRPMALLETYWSVPPHQREASVVLRYERPG